jgi:hypothetical protein
MANRTNVGQHVVPRCYLKHFSDAKGTIYVQEKVTGRIFPSGPDALCKENDVYTLLVVGKRDYSFESINNDIESAIGPILTELREGIDLDREGVQTRIFTHLAVFTANLIARSRVLRQHMDGSLDRINTLLAEQPDIFKGFPEAEYQRFLKHPEAFPDLLERFPGGTKYLSILREATKHAPPSSTVDDTIECLNAVKNFHYPVLLKARTGATANLIVEIGAMADLLLSDTARLISGDDPVVFLTGGVRETMVVPTNSRHWAEPGRGIYLPLNPSTAILWNAEGTYSPRVITAEQVRAFNTLVKENSLRYVLACNPSDFAVL